MKKLFFLFLLIAITAVLYSSPPQTLTVGGNDDFITVTAENTVGALIQANVDNCLSVTEAQQIVSVLPTKIEQGNITGEMEVMKGVADLPPLILTSSFNESNGEYFAANKESEVVYKGCNVVSISSISSGDALTDSSQKEMMLLNVNEFVISKLLLANLEEMTCGTVLMQKNNDVATITGLNLSELSETT